MTDAEMICIGCGKHPSELAEYVEAAEEEPEYYDNAAHYVQQEEGTFNPINGHFLCTPCYVSAGMPTVPRGWRAP
jgi:hypothetical protein